jgi:hypothetical protein
MWLTGGRTFLSECVSDIFPIGQWKEYAGIIAFPPWLDFGMLKKKSFGFPCEESTYFRIKNLGFTRKYFYRKMMQLLFVFPTMAIGGVMSLERKSAHSEGCRPLPFLGRGETAAAIGQGLTESDDSLKLPNQIILLRRGDEKKGRFQISLPKIPNIRRFRFFLRR